MPTHKQLTILVVDDNPPTLYSTSRVLRQAGFQVLTAQTGNEALRVAEASQVDLVVLDINLPDVDGYHVCQELRNREGTAQVPVIYLSASFVSDVDKAHGLNAGADGYLTHPVEPPVLIATVNAFMRARFAESALRQSEVKFRAIFNEALNGISLLTEDLMYLDVNPAMCRLLGRPKQEIVGKHLSVFLPQNAERQLPEIAATVKETGVFRGIFALLGANGRPVQLEWSISFRAIAGTHVAIVSDVTERNALEAERELLLHSERAARAEAESANRMKDEFLAVLSHELRNPLNTILGWTQILQRTPNDEKNIAQGLDAIQRNAKLQSELIADLLDVSRITSGKMELDLREIDPVAVLNAAIDGAERAADEKKITIERDIDPDIGIVSADPSRLQQVVWNLVNNAVKFTQPGGEVRVSSSRKGQSFEIVVRDNGEGIRPDFLPHLFDRFRQADPSSRRSHGGLGLGLAIAKYIVDLHGGTISATSPGQSLGSEFRVELPTGKRVTQAAVSATTDQDTPSTDLHGLRVLVVDDDNDCRELLVRMLREANAEVRGESSAHAALQTVEEFCPQVVVSDIGMPEVDGYDFIRALRARSDRAKALPAIALTAFARREDKEHALLAGYQMHIGKPVVHAQLVAAIKKLAHPQS